MIAKKTFKLGEYVVEPTKFITENSMVQNKRTMLIRYKSETPLNIDEQKKRVFDILKKIQTLNDKTEVGANNKFRHKRDNCIKYGRCQV